MKVAKHMSRFSNEILKYQLEIFYFWMLKVLSNLSYIRDLTRWFPKVPFSVIIFSDYSIIILIRLVLSAKKMTKNDKQRNKLLSGTFYIVMEVNSTQNWNCFLQCIFSYLHQIYETKLFYRVGLSGMSHKVQHGRIILGGICILKGL